MARIAGTPGQVLEEAHNAAAAVRTRHHTLEKSAVVGVRTEAAVADSIPQSTGLAADRSPVIGIPPRRSAGILVQYTHKEGSEKAD